MTQTAVEWLEELIECGADFEQIKKCLQKAKAMEKEQIVIAYQSDRNPCSDEDAEQYYQETYGGNNAE